MYLKLFFILLTCFSLFAQIPTDSLVAYYPFNGNAKNMVGNGNNDGIVKGATLVADRFGNINSAYHFVPGQDISVKNITLPAGNFSLSFWFKPEAYPTGATRLISGCYFSVAYWNDGHLGANGPSAPQINYNGIQLNKYYHIVFIYSNVAKLYVNNVLVGDSTAPAYTGCTNDSLIIGGYSVWPLASGCIDDIRIYRRSLTASEVSALYNEGIQILLPLLLQICLLCDL